MNGVEQYELSSGGAGKITGALVRKWPLGKCEGAVADDVAGKIYVTVEDEGVWEFAGDPDEPVAPNDLKSGKLILKVGDHGLKADLEGIALFPTSAFEGYLIVSSQGSSFFHVFDRMGNHRFIGSFAVEGAGQTDGIDAIPTGLGTDFPQGMFACHTDSDGHPLLITSWSAIANAFRPNLSVNSNFDPRHKFPATR